MDVVAARHFLNRKWCHITVKNVRGSSNTQAHAKVKCEMSSKGLVYENLHQAFLYMVLILYNPGYVSFSH